MSNEQIEKGIRKAFQTLIFKGNIDFEIEVEQKIGEYSFNPEHVRYEIYVYFTVDHAKFWGSSPEFSREYNDLINHLDSLEEKMNDVIKYILPTEEYNLWVLYNHYNTNIYKPLLDKIGELELSFISNFMESTPAMEVVLDIKDEDNHNEIFTELSEHFDIDDIIMYFDDLSD